MVPGGNTPFTSPRRRPPPGGLSFSGRLNRRAHSARSRRRTRPRHSTGSIACAARLTASLALPIATPNPALANISRSLSMSPSTRISSRGTPSRSAEQFDQPPLVDPRRDHVAIIRLRAGDIGAAGKRRCSQFGQPRDRSWSSLGPTILPTAAKSASVNARTTVGGVWTVCVSCSTCAPSGLRASPLVADEQPAIDPVLAEHRDRFLRRHRAGSTSARRRREGSPARRCRRHYSRRTAAAARSGSIIIRSPNGGRLLQIENPMPVLVQPPHRRDRARGQPLVVR